MRRLALVAPCIVSLTGCPSDSGSDGSGTADTTASTDPTNPTTSTTVSTTVSASETDPTTGMTTDMTTDPDTTIGESSTTDTGVGECPYAPVAGMPAIGLQLIAGGFDRPVLALGDPSQPDRLFVVEQGGAVKILEPGATTAPEAEFLHVNSVNQDNDFIGDERGLLGFAFHPDFPTDPRVYVAYSAAGAGGASAPTRISEFTLMAGDANQVDPASERILLDGEQPAGNHNGGMIAFGPDNLLYIGFGDGGGSDDQFNTGRDTSTILAKILRIDPNPSGDLPYTIPADNPFVGNDAFAPEIFAWGFRNPWRFSFDQENGDLYVADVGQYDWEEIDIVSAGGDYGWSDMEGFSCFEGAACDVVDTPNAVNEQGMTMPILAYNHDALNACSITGGGVYRSCEVEAWQGLYLYGDFCTGDLYGLVWDGANVMDFASVLSTGESIIGNGWNAWGDVYITTVQTSGPMIEDGLVYRVAPV